MRALLIVLIATTAGAVDAQNVPRITSMTPNYGTAMTPGFSVTVNGENFGNVQQDVVVRLNGEDRTTTYVSATQLRVTLLDSDLARSGTPQVTVFRRTGTGVLSSPATFTVNNPTPTIASLSPVETRVSAARTFTVTGTAFAPNVAVLLNGKPFPFMRVSLTQLTMYVNASDIAAGGLYTIRVQNPSPGGGISERNFNVIAPPTVTTFSIGGSGNPDRVWAWPTVQQFAINGAGGRLWRLAPTELALQTTPWKPSSVPLSYAFGQQGSNDCGLLNPSQYLRATELYVQVGVAVGPDTLVSSPVRDQVVVRLPWCSPIRIYTPPAWAGFPTNDVGDARCPVGRVMNGIRVRTVSGSPVTVSAIAAICAGSQQPFVGTPEGMVTLDATYATGVPFIQVFSTNPGTLNGIMSGPGTLPSWLNGNVTYDPLYARVVGGTVTASGSSWTPRCPTDGVPIGMDVHRGSNGRPTALSLLCVVQDISPP